MVTLKQALTASRWLRAQFAVLVFGLVYLPTTLALSHRLGASWSLLAVAVYATAGGACFVGARRDARMLKMARLRMEAEMRGRDLAAEAKTIEAETR